jgi:uncharacterized protein YneF (UPF0154 family)
MIDLVAHGTALILAMGAGIVIGIYITTQISCWIDKNIKKDK